MEFSIPPTQFLLKMRLTVFLIIATCLQVSARTGYSQTVSFSGKNVPIQAVFSSIEKQTGLSFFFNDALMKDAKPVTLELKDATLDDAMHEVLMGQELDYYVTGKTIFIIKKRVGTASKQTVMDGPVPGKTVKIEGAVYNESGEPLAGANVTIKEVRKGTVTDAKGAFDLGEIPANSTLMISFIGYTTEQIKVNETGTIKVYLKVAKSELDRAVVQAYGTTTQRLATGNIGTVTAEDIAKQPVANPLEALQGQIAGVQVTQTSGFASAPFKVEIRGRSSLDPSATSDPLYIVDGVPMQVLDISGSSSYASGSPGLIQSGFGSPESGQSPFFSINPADIESITVLKDADATAIYGSRGAQGVVLITTKKGKPGKTHFELNAFQGDQVVPHYYSMLNTPQYVAMREEALANDGLPVDINNAPDLVGWDTTRYTNWQKAIWGGMGKMTNAEASLSGGDVRTTFRVGGGYTSIWDVQAVSGSNQRGTLSLDIHHSSLNQRLSLNMTSLYSYIYINEIYIPAAVTLPPNAPAIFDKHGNLNYAGWNPISNYYQFSALQTPYESKTGLLNTNLDIGYEVLKGLTMKAVFGYNWVNLKQENFQTIASQNPATDPTGSSFFGYNSVQNLIFEPQINYHGFVAKGKIEGLIGSTVQSNSTEGLLVSGGGYTSDALIKSIAAAPIQFSSDNYGQFKYAAVFGRLNYNLGDKYIININVRRDGSSKFGPGRQYGNFGSVGGAWIFSEENWVKRTLPILSFGKLRGSYGLTGSDNIPNYQYQTLWQPVPAFLYNGLRGISIIGASDSLLQWEVKRKIEVSFDLGFFNDRFSIEATWYRERCGNQLTSYPTPNFTGFPSVYANWPADVQNMGYEFQVNSKNIDGKHFSWLTKFNIGINRNKLLAYPDLQASPFSSKYQIGKPLNNVFLLHNTGVDPQTGLYTFEDKNKDGQITIDYGHPGTADDRFIYDLTPKFSGGLTNVFNYKNWSCSIFFYFIRVKGINALAAISSPGGISNEPTSILQHWQKPGDISTTAKFTTEPYLSNSYNYYSSYSDGIYSDASFIRLQNLSLSYRLPMKTSGSEMKFFMKAENLFTITDYNGIDPEVQVFGGMPLLRTITFGASLNL